MARTVICRASPAALARGYEGMVFADQEALAAMQLLGPAVHQEAADALEPVLRRLLKR